METEFEQLKDKRNYHERIKEPNKSGQGIFEAPEEKSRIRETLTLSTDADHRTDIYIYILFFWFSGELFFLPPPLFLINYFIFNFFWSSGELFF